MDNYISAQVKYWKQQKNKVDVVDLSRDRQRDRLKLPFITISREYGCGGYAVAERITELLNAAKGVTPPWAAYNRELLDRVMKDMGLSTQLMETMTGNARKTMTDLFQTYFDKFPPQVAVYRKLAETVQALARVGHVILVGRASNYITRDIPMGFHVRIIASMDHKVDTISGVKNINRKDAEKLIKEKTRQRDSFINEYLKYDVTDNLNYDLVVNNSTHTIDEVAQLIIATMKLRRLIAQS
jgi:cytidylate kinase